MEIKKTFESFITEASRRKVHKAAKDGSYPAVIVVVKDGKVIHQEPVSSPEVAPATFNVIQKEYPNALLHLEDKTGKRLFSESVVNEMDSEGIQSLADELNAEVYTARLKNGAKSATIKATTTTKTWDDGAPVLKYLARGKAQSMAFTLYQRPFTVLHDVAHGWFYFTDGRKWYGLYGDEGYSEPEDLPFDMEISESVVTEDVDMDDLENAKYRLKDQGVYKHLDIEYKQTRRSEKYVQIHYIPISRPQSQNPEWVNVRYDNAKDLNKISKELNMDLKESVVTESVFSFKTDNIEQLHFETDPKTAEEMKIELGKMQGEVSKRKQIESAEYSLRRFRKEIGYGNGKDVGVFLPGSYDASISKLGDGPHKKAVKAVKWNQRKYDQWLEDMASNGGAENAFDMAQNAKNERGLIDWVKKNFRGDDPLQRIQWDIEAFTESVVTEAKFVKDFNRDVLNAKTKEEVLELYPNAEFFIGKMTHFFGELEPNLFFKAYYTKGQKEFEIKSVYSEKGSSYVHLYNESVVTDSNEGKAYKTVTDKDGNTFKPGRKYKTQYGIATFIKFSPNDRIIHLKSDEMGAVKTSVDNANKMELIEESVVTEAKFDKKKLMKAVKGDDGIISTGDGKEYVIYKYDNGNDDNDAMWNDKTIFALDQDGDEHEIKYSDIVSYNESVVTEGRSINKIQKDWNQTTTDMQAKVAQWKEAEGDRKSELLDELKALTAKKKALEAELEDAVAGKDKDVQLAVSEGNAFLAARAKAIEEGTEEFEFNGKTYPVIKEGNAFGAARAEAIAKDEEEFEVDGEKFPVKSVDKEDEDNAEEFVEETAEITLDSLVEKFAMTNEDLRTDVKKFIKENNKELNMLADNDQWDLMYQKLYSEFGVEPDSAKAKDLLKTFQFVF